MPFHCRLSGWTFVPPYSIKSWSVPSSAHHRVGISPGAQAVAVQYRAFWLIGIASCDVTEEVSDYSRGWGPATDPDGVELPSQI
jgi:hypothetical protein